MKSGIYYVVGYKLIRDNSCAEMSICSELINRNETIMIPVTKEEIISIKDINYIVYFKISKARIIIEKCKTIEEAEKKLFQLQTFYSQGIQM